MVHLAVIGWTEWIIIFCVVALLFGARKIPELARSLGSSVNEFKKGMKNGGSPSDGAPPEGLEKEK